MTPPELGGPASGEPAGADPYVDPATGVLRNRLGLTDPDHLEDAEADFCAVRLAGLGRRPLPGDYDLAHLARAHLRRRLPLGRPTADRGALQGRHVLPAPAPRDLRRRGVRAPGCHRPSAWALAGGPVHRDRAGTEHDVDVTDVGLGDRDPVHAREQVTEVYRHAATPGYVRDREQLHQLLAGLPLVDPGLVDAAACIWAVRVGSS